MIRPLMTASSMLLPLFALVQSQPAAPPKVWPREVQALYDSLKEECRADGGKFIPDRAHFAVETEVTGDGKPDWVVDYSSARCSNAGYSVYCGTAGCMIAIFGSDRNGYREIFNDNVRDWQAVKLDGKGRTGLGLSVHGTVCGSVGADMCLEVLRWDGRKWAVVERRRGTDADLSASTGEDAGPPPALHSARWQVAGSGAGTVAAVTGHPEFTAVGLRCQPGGGMAMTIVPAKGLHLPPPGKPLLIGFRSAGEGSEATQSLNPETAKPDFSGALDPVARGLLMGADSDLSLYASYDGGDEWIELTALSLAGSTAAIRTLEKQCPRGAAANAGGAAGPGQSRILPLPVGYYVDARMSTCEKPFADIAIYLAEDRIVQRGSSCKFTSLKMTNANAFRQTESCPDIDGRPMPATQDYRITGPQSFELVGFGDAWTFCSANRLPAKAKFYRAGK